jgi:glycosyltransferase involved in cell wall biosynthesis
MSSSKIDIKNFMISIIIPVYNEKDTIKDIINAVEETPFRKEIIVIDDGSTDGTGIILSKIKKEGLNIYLATTLWHFPQFPLAKSP